RVGWSAQLTVPEPMAVEPEPAADRPSGSAAVDTGTRPRSLDRRRCGKPPLDVECVMEDSWRASGRLQQGPTGSTTSAVLVTPSTSPIRRAPCSAPKGGARFYLNQPVRCESPSMRGSRCLPITQAASKPCLYPQQACPITVCSFGIGDKL